MELEGELEDALKKENDEVRKSSQDEQDIRKKLHIHLLVEIVNIHVPLLELHYEKDGSFPIYVCKSSSKCRTL